ncbi:MAG: universal stress protein [Deltaproteobacteria bacterium]|nr:universal stress protein [Deltaproteobacteria bacterium]
MERKVLVAVDDSIHTRTCLSYLNFLAARIPDFSVTLFHVQPTISDYLVEEARKNLKAKNTLDTLIEKNRGESAAVLDRCRQTLIRGGLPVEKIETHTSQKISGLAKDIIDKGVADQYDAIVTGRRGLSGLQKWVMGSVSSNLVEHSPVPVWIVTGKSFNARILVAVDGSASALKAVDHALFMAGPADSLKITLFHVRSVFQDYRAVAFEDAKPVQQMLKKKNRGCMEDFFRKVRMKFREHGVDEKRVEFREEDRKLSVAQAILAASKVHEFGTIVVGKRGIGRSFYMGSVSNAIIKNSTDRVVWMVP